MINGTLADALQLEPGRDAHRHRLVRVGRSKCSLPVSLRRRRHCIVPVRADRRAHDRRAPGDARARLRRTRPRSGRHGARRIYAATRRGCHRHRAAPPGSPRGHERADARTHRAGRLHLLPADLHRAHHGDRGLRPAPHLRAAHRLGQSAARRDRRAARARLLATPRRGRRPVRISAHRRHRRTFCRCRTGLLLASWLDHILKRCRTSPRTCISSSSSPARWSSISRCSSSPRSSPRSIRCSIVARLPIAATLRNEVIS